MVTGQFTFGDDQWFTGEIMGRAKRFLESKENETTTYQNPSEMKMEYHNNYQGNSSLGNTLKAYMLID
jgi:hypothetical protein